MSANTSSSAPLVSIRTVARPSPTVAITRNSGPPPQFQTHSGATLKLVILDLISCSYVLVIARWRLEDALQLFFVGTGEKAQTYLSLVVLHGQGASSGVVAHSLYKFPMEVGGGNLATPKLGAHSCSGFFHDDVVARSSKHPCVTIPVPESLPSAEEEFIISSFLQVVADHNVGTACKFLRATH